jgi:hypothetical protein
MIFVDQLFDIDAAQHKLLSIDRGKSRFSGHAVVAHIRSLPMSANSAMTLLARYTISSRLPERTFTNRHSFEKLGTSRLSPVVHQTIDARSATSDQGSTARPRSREIVGR